MRESNSPSPLACGGQTPARLGGPATGLRISVLVPTLNEALVVERALSALRGAAFETIVADGGSIDATCAVAAGCGATVVRSQPGRAAQMNAAAALATGDVLLFLHADTRLPPSALQAVRAAVAGGAAWGRFDVRIEPGGALLRLVAAAMNARSRATGICTGDQAIFVARSLWEAAGGYAPIPLMEDIELSARLRRIAPPVALPGPAVTSSRRWHARGVARTIAEMWFYRAAYFAGVSPARLHAWYYGRPAR